MRPRRRVSGLLLLWASSAVFAGVDLSDFDTEAMQNVDDASKELESALAAKEVAASVGNAEFIRDSLRWAEGYFQKKGGAIEAVRLAGQGRELAVAIATAASKGDFDAASESYTSLVRTCKSCHDAYKPPSL